MKKFFYLFVATIVFIACTNDGYVVTGSVEGAAEGSMVYLSYMEKGTYVNLDSALIKDGVFVFRGKQDTAVRRYVRTQERVGNTNKKLYTDFFLENGKINLTLTSWGNTVSGTPNNEVYQAVRNEIYDRQKSLVNLSNAEQTQEFNNISTEVMTKAVSRYITMPVGIHFLKQVYLNLNAMDLAALVEQIPERMTNDPFVLRIKDRVAKQQACAVGCEFVDFTMQDPDGKEVKLSDYAGKGKVVLVDFWASWCGPCCAAIPGLIEMYEQYKDKGFEVVGVSLDLKAEDWKAALKKLNMPWPQMSDLKGWWGEGVQAYVVGTIPHVILIDGEGKIVVKGSHLEEVQREIVETLKLR